MDKLNGQNRKISDLLKAGRADSGTYTAVVLGWWSHTEMAVDLDSNTHAGSEDEASSLGEMRGWNWVPYMKPRCSQKSQKSTQEDTKEAQLCSDSKWGRTVP